MSAELDAGWASLMTDLAERGLLESTTIVWMGEFGRTPQINGQAGRDHFPRAWSCVLGGGGIAGGQAYGRTSADGMDIEEDPVEVTDVLATLCSALGVPPETENTSNTGRPIKIVDGFADRETCWRREGSPGTMQGAWSVEQRAMSGLDRMRCAWQKTTDLGACLRGEVDVRIMSALIVMVRGVMPRRRLGGRIWRSLNRKRLASCRRSRRARAPDDARRAVVFIRGAPTAVDDPLANYARTPLGDWQMPVEVDRDDPWLRFVLFAIKRPVVIDVAVFVDGKPYADGREAWIDGVLDQSAEASVTSANRRAGWSAT